MRNFTLNKTKLRRHNFFLDNKVHRQLPPLPTLQTRVPGRRRGEGHRGHQAAHRHGLHEILSLGRSKADDWGLQGFHIPAVFFQKPSFISCRTGRRLSSPSWRWRWISRRGRGWTRRSRRPSGGTRSSARGRRIAGMSGWTRVIWRTVIIKFYTLAFCMLNLFVKMRM